MAEKAMRRQTAAQVQLWWEVRPYKEQQGRTQPGSIPFPVVRRQEQARSALCGQELGAAAGCTRQVRGTRGGRWGTSVLERTGVTRARSGRVSDGARVLSAAACIPSDSPDSPAKDEAGAEGEEGREPGPRAVAPHGDPCEGQGKGQRRVSPGSPSQGCGVGAGCAVRCPSEQGTAGIPRAPHPLLLPVP